jgi:hypothetical protein
MLRRFSSRSLISFGVHYGKVAIFPAIEYAYSLSVSIVETQEILVPEIQFFRRLVHCHSSRRGLRRTKNPDVQLFMNHRHFSFVDVGMAVSKGRPVGFNQGEDFGVGGWISLLNFPASQLCVLVFADHFIVLLAKCALCFVYQKINSAVWINILLFRGNFDRAGFKSEFYQVLRTIFFDNYVECLDSVRVFFYSRQFALNIRAK